MRITKAMWRVSSSASSPMSRLTTCPAGVEFGGGYGFEPTGLKVTDAFDHDVLPASGMHLLDLDEPGDAPRRGGHVLMVERDAESIVLFTALAQGVLQLSDQLAVTGLEDVQAGPFSGKEEDPKGKQGNPECRASHHFNIRE